MPWKLNAERVTDTSLRRTQKRRRLLIRAGLIAALALVSVTRSAGPPGTLVHESVEIVGVALLVLCILGRTWSSLYIGGSKRVALVDIGPYSVVRNPLYVFSLLGAGGVGLCTGSVVVGLAFAAITFLVFHRVVLSEESFLREKFGQAFDDYANGVPRWWPNFAGWRDAESVTARPATIRQAFLDTSLFLLAVPVCEGIDFLQQTGILPVLLKLP